MNIGERIKNLRLNKNFKATQFAENVGISRVYLNEIERGIKIPTIETLQKICDALGITFSEFFSTGEDTINPEYLELVDNAKVLTHKQLKILNEFLKALKEKNDNE
ncbi:XRE family transcriptional regulator [Biomaibacter acetigenes]|uniref:XRE family transcriptional regulator n=1 Tax=Biomaibacter acetigenes TaxID=2316383 RepID=A0A3G2R7N9_9FIRM|nr:helix-turn-helix transcriptional regulator [Biomaibacter acetigenes]AYO31395.1 XRE family transcriptional regulator [Biomaibacter acetigenes]